MSKQVDPFRPFAAWRSEKATDDPASTMSFDFSNGVLTCTETIHHPERYIRPWYPGLTCDHLYEDCPNRRRGLAELRRYDMDFVGGEGGKGFGIDPLDPDTCGMCAYRWKRKNGVA